MEKSSSLKIVILNYNSPEDTVALYSKICDTVIPEAEILVIDNASKDRSRQILETKIPEVFLVFNEKNLGYAGGNRIGIERAVKTGADYLLLLNPDIRPESGCIEKLLQQISADENIAAIGPRICFRNAPETIYSDGGIVEKEKGFYAFHKNYKQNVNQVQNPGLHEVDYVNGSCFLIRTSLYKEIGPMREDFFLYFEETEWCLRARKAGYKCMVDSNALASHSSSEKNNIYHFYMTRNRILLAKSQNEEVRNTYIAVARPVLRALLNNLQHFEYPSQETRARLKGILASLFRN